MMKIPLYEGRTGRATVKNAQEEPKEGAASNSVPEKCVDTGRKDKTSSTEM